MQTNRTTTAQALLAAAFLLLVSASTTASDAFAKAGREQVIYYLNTIDVIGDGLPEVFKDKLDGFSTVHGMIWWKVFDTLLAAESALADFEKGNFAAAGATLARMSADQLIPSTPVSGAFSGANAIADLAALPIKLSLNKFVKLVNGNAFKLQVELYKAARNRGLSHQQIMNRHAPSEDILYDRSSGYLLSVSGLGAKAYGARIPMAKLITREEVYELSRVAYESGSLTSQVRQERDRAVREFVDYVRTNSPKIPTFIPADNAELPLQMRTDEKNAFRLWLKQNARFRPALLTDCLCNEDLPYIRKSYANEHPYYAAGDFNKDGKRDFAVIVIDRSNRSTPETAAPPSYFNSSVVIFSRSKSSNDFKPFALSAIGIPRSTLLFLSRETGQLIVGQWEGETSPIVFVANRYAYAHL